MTTPSVAAPAFALVRAPIAPMHAEPRVSSGQVSQTLFGHPTTLVDTEGDWHRVRTLDGYEGWAHAGYLALIDDAGADGLDVAALREVAPADVSAPSKAGSSTNGASPSGTFDPDRLTNLLGDGVPRVSLGCVVRAGDRTLRLPLGAWVHASQTLLGGEATRLDEMPVTFPRDADALMRSAARWFEGTSYQWGGLTPWGADCSGLVQTVFGLHGVALPRDAWQQARVGHDAGDDVEALDKGSLLFFSDREDRRVTHVGISLGGPRMAHVALGRGGWSIENLNDVSDPYVAALRAHFVGARRVI